MSITLNELMQIDPSIEERYLRLKQIAEQDKLEQKKDFLKDIVDETILIAGRKVFQLLDVDFRAFRNGELVDKEAYFEGVCLEVVSEMERIYEDGKDLEKLMKVVNHIVVLSIDGLMKVDSDNSIRERFEFLSSANPSSKKFIEFRNQYVAFCAMQPASDLIDKCDKYGLYDLLETL